MESIVTRVARRIVDWPYKQRACGRMRHIAINMLRMPDDKAVWHKVSFRKAWDPQSPFTIEFTHNGNRQSTLIVYDGERLYNLERDALMGMERDEFEKLFTLLEEQNSLGHKYHTVTTTPARPDFTPVDIEDVITASVRTS